MRSRTEGHRIMATKFSRSGLPSARAACGTVPLSTIRGWLRHCFPHGEGTLLQDGSGGYAAVIHFFLKSRRRRRIRPWIIALVTVLGVLSSGFASVAGSAKAATVDVADITPPYNSQLDAVKAPTGVFGIGKIWHVGPNEQDKTFSSIATRLRDGDVVEIDAGTYGCTEQSIVWNANNVTVIGVGGRAIFDATGCTISRDKGIFNPRGTNMIIDNIAFIGAQGPSRNDAGIRLDGGGYVYITHSYFGNSQNGVLLTPGAPANIVIDHSEFSGNGNCFNGSGVRAQHVYQ